MAGFSLMTAKIMHGTAAKRARVRLITERLNPVLRAAR
jgi:hypothetical protein